MMGVARRLRKRSISLRLRAEGDELRHLFETAAGRWLIGTVAAVALATVVGLVALWPYGWNAPGSSTALTVPGTVKQVTDRPCAGDPAAPCRMIVAAVEGTEVQFGLGPVRNAPSLSVGDRIRLTRSGD